MLWIKHTLLQEFPRMHYKVTFCFRLERIFCFYNLPYLHGIELPNQVIYTQTDIYHVYSLYWNNCALRTTNWTGNDSTQCYIHNVNATATLDNNCQGLLNVSGYHHWNLITVVYFWGIQQSYSNDDYTVLIIYGIYQQQTIIVV